MDAFILLVLTSVSSFLAYRYLTRLAEKDRQKRIKRLQDWIDEGGLDEAIRRRYGIGRR